MRQGTKKMGKWTGTLIGGGIGWALGGPIGALIGAYLGNLFTETSPRKGVFQQLKGRSDNVYGDTRAGDFAVAMLSLFAYVSKADKSVKSSEIAYVKKFLIDKFGKQNAQDLLYLYKEILQKEYDIYKVSKQIRIHMDYYSRLELVHILFGIAAADGTLHKSEISATEQISAGLGIAPEDLRSIQSIFVRSTDQAYGILNIRPDDDSEVIKKAYRELATKYHPDKVANLGPEIQKLAEEKFKSINDAYQTIRKERGF